MRISRSDHERTAAPCVVAEAEQVRGEPRRERRGEVVDDVELAALDEAVDEVVDDRGRSRGSSRCTALGVNRRATSARCSWCAGSSLAIMSSSCGAIRER